jgi:hypothetical protein
MLCTSSLTFVKPFHPSLSLIQNTPDACLTCAMQHDRARGMNKIKEGSFPALILAACGVDKHSKDEQAVLASTSTQASRAAGNLAQDCCEVCFKGLCGNPNKDT